MGTWGAGIYDDDYASDLRDSLAVKLREWPEKKRKTMSKPQPLLLEVGEVIVYPLSKGAPVNPYRGDRTADKHWAQNGWGAAVVVEADRIFGYLAWYRPVKAQRIWEEKPSLETVLEVPDWNLEHAATCSSRHYQRMELEKIGQVELSSRWEEHLGERFVTGKQAALSDISIANSLDVVPGEEFGKMGVSELLAGR